MGLDSRLPREEGRFLVLATVIPRPRISNHGSVRTLGGGCVRPEKAGVTRTNQTTFQGDQEVPTERDPGKEGEDSAELTKCGENLLSNSRWARIPPCPGALVKPIWKDDRTGVSAGPCPPGRAGSSGRPKPKPDVLGSPRRKRASRRGGNASERESCPILSMPSRSPLEARGHTRSLSAAGQARRAAELHQIAPLCPGASAGRGV